MIDEAVYELPNYLSFFGFSNEQPLPRLKKTSVKDREQMKDMVKPAVKPAPKMQPNLPQKKVLPAQKPSDDRFGGLKPFEFHHLPDEMKDEWAGFVAVQRNQDSDPPENNFAFLK